MRLRAGRLARHLDKVLSGGVPGQGDVRQPGGVGDGLGNDGLRCIEYLYLQVWPGCMYGDAIRDAPRLR